MLSRSQALLELRVSYEEVLAAREAAATAEGEDVLRGIRHAERNFLATAEALARQVPKLVPQLGTSTLLRRARRG